jgi:ATF/CREB family transcription factor
MMNNPQTPSSALANAAATITPNTLNAITGVLANHNSSNSTSTSQPHPLSVSHLPSNGNDNTVTQYPANSNAYSSQAANVASTAANGLFLLSQAHQELTKREAQARSNNIPVVSTSPTLPAQQQTQQSHLKRGTKRKSTGDSASPNSPLLPTTKGKRARADTTSSITSNGMRTTTSSDEQEEEEEDDEIDEPLFKRTTPKSNGATTTNGAGARSKAPMTEEEKRKNFLERNRQGNIDPCRNNLKCKSHHAWQPPSSVGNVRRRG